RLAAEAVRDNRDVIRDKVRTESPWWVPGVVDDQIFQRIIGTVESLLRDIGTDPYHPLRAAFDTALRDFVDRLQHAPDVIAKAAEPYRHEIGDLIPQTFAGWDPEATSRRFELAVGRDLQFVRINGTLVGGLVGLAIYTVSQLLR